jgi:hypothetical protein
MQSQQQLASAVRPPDWAVIKLSWSPPPPPPPPPRSCLFCLDGSSFHAYACVLFLRRVAFVVLQLTIVMDETLASSPVPYYGACEGSINKG